MFSARFLLIVPLACLVASGPAVADPAVTREVPRERRNSINLDPLGAVFGAYEVNVEHLRGSHGLLVEGAYASQGDGEARATAVGGGLGWRWHWRGRQNSGFVGVMTGFYMGTGDVTVITVMGDSTTMEHFDIATKELALTANIGKRWQFDMGLNITLRLGVGYAKRWFSTDSTDPDAQDAVESVEDLMSFLPIAADGELSVGYSF